VGVGAWYSAIALILKRIRALLDAANRVRGGDFSVRINPPPGKGELSQLAAAFDAGGFGRADLCWSLHGKDVLFGL